MSVEINTKEIAEEMQRELSPIGNTSVAPAHGIAAIALNMAMKYHAMTIVNDGTMYQQYKMEGRNLVPLDLQMVFDTAIQIEMHLLGSSERIAKLVVDAITFDLKDETDEDGRESTAVAVPDGTS